MAGLFEALRAGDPEAASAIDGMVRGFARHVCRHGAPHGPAPDWEDVAQEAIRRLYDVGLDQYAGQGSERSYVYSIVKATLIQMARGDGRRRRREDVVAPAVDQAAAGNPDPALDVRAILGALDPSCRELIVRVHLRDEPYAMLAREMGLAESSVRAKVSRCMQRARELVGGEDRS